MTSPAQPFLSEAECAELAKLEKAATPGPWSCTPEAEKSDVCIWAPDGSWLANVGNWARLHVISGYDDDHANPRHVEIVETEHHSSAALIAAARNALPRLLQERAALRAALARFVDPEHVLTFEGNMEAHAFFSVDQVNDARALLSGGGAREEGTD